MREFLLTTLCLMMLILASVDTKNAIICGDTYIACK